MAKEFNLDDVQVIPTYSIITAMYKAGLDTGYGRAFAKGLIYENAGLTPVYLYDSVESSLYVMPQEYIDKTVTLH